MKTKVMSYIRSRSIAVSWTLIYVITFSTTRVASADDVVPSSISKPEGDRIILSIAELPELRREVKSLREDVRRLCELLEKKRNDATVDVPADNPNQAVESPANSNNTLPPQETPAATSETDKLLYFSARWCGPCQQMNPTVAKLKRLGLPIEVIDVDLRQDLTRQHRVDGIPCLVLIKAGKEVARKTGVQNEAELRELIKSIETLAATTDPADTKRTSDDQGELVQQIYPIADLLISFGDTDSAGKEIRLAKLTMAKWWEVIDLITTTIEPHCWRVNGGHSTIATDEKTLSLIILARTKIHEEVHDLLSQVRRKQKIQICTEARWVRNVENDFLSMHGINVEFDPVNNAAKMTPANATRFLECVKVFAPNLTSFNNQVSHISDHSTNNDEYPSDFRLFYRAKVLEDQKQVRLNLAFNPVSLIDELIAPAVFLADGESALFDVNELIRQKHPGFTASSKTFVLIRPRVIIQDPEQDKMLQK